MSHVAMGRILAFCSYAHEDAQHLANLEAALAPLRDEAIIDHWSDSSIGAGQEWDASIKVALEKARLVLFVVTPHLLQSDYINEQEIPLSLARMKQRKCEVVPVLAERPEKEAIWHANPLAKLQPLPRVGHWISDYADPVSAYKLVCLGVRDACGRIGGGDNPYQRAEVGDWRHCLRRFEFPNGQWAEWEFTEELVSKTDTTAEVFAQTTMHGPVIDKRLTCDLTKPLQSQAEDFASQTGLDVSQAATMTQSAAAGGPEISEEVLAIGFKSYETRVLSMTSHAELNGMKMETRARVWTSIDVPFDGAVKTRQDQSWDNGATGSQTTTLLDFGFGDAAERKPVPAIRTPLTAEAAAALGIRVPEGVQPPANTQPGHAGQPPDALSLVKGAWKQFVSGVKQGWQQQSAPQPQWRIFPGHWMIQAHDHQGMLAYDVMLHPNGQVQGTGINNDFHAQLTGTWGFDPGSAMLRLQITATAPGFPPTPYWNTFRIVGSDPGAFHACDPNGRQFRIWIVSG